MDSSVMLVLGGAMILVGFLSTIRYRIAQARRRLTPAASIRGRLPGNGAQAYSASSGGTAMGRSVSLLLMLGGGVVLLAGVLS